MKSKLLTILFVGVMVVALLGGCNSGSDKGSSSITDTGAQQENSGSTTGDTTSENTASAGVASSVTLTLYGNADDLAKPYMQKIISMWEEQSGNKIDQQGLETNNAETVALTKFVTGDIPDLYIHFGNSNLLNFNVDKNFYDFSDAPWVDDIMSNVLPQTKVDGKVIGLPFWEASVSGCFYNKKIFEEQGITELPKTQEEFNGVCDQLVAAGVTPIYLAASDAWPILYQFALDPVFDSADGAVLLEKLNNNEIKYADIPEVTSMLEWFKMAADKGYFGDNFMTDTWDYTSEVLGTGEAAMMFCWDTWFDTDYDNETFQFKSSDFGLMPIYMNTSDQGTFEGPNVNLMMVNKNGEKLEVALDFLNFMAQPENYNVAFKDVATAPVFKQETENVISSQLQGARDWVDQVGHASVAAPKVIGFSQSEGGKAIQELMSGNITVEECIMLLDDDRIATLKSFEQ